MQFFDTHAHLDSDDFDGQLDTVLERCRDARVTDVIAVGTTAASSRVCLELSRRDSIHAAVGIQPNYCHEAEPGDWAAVEKMAREDNVVAIGETGLDGYWDRCPMDIQRDYFDRHIRLSQTLGLPFIVHLRESAEPILEMLTAARSRGALRGVMHSYTGDEAMAEACLDLGMHISFAGMVTFKKSDGLRVVAKSVPHDRILIETDAPYLSPEPMRGKRPNDPSRVVHTAACLAEVRGVTLAEFAAQTFDNARQLFLSKAAVEKL